MRKISTADDAQDAELQQCLDFLHKHMPARDRGQITQRLLVHHAKLALKARRANAWAAEVPWEVFLNDVLPYRNLDEPIDIDWRSMFYKLFAPMVAETSSLTEAAQVLNRCAKHSTYLPYARQHDCSAKITEACNSLAVKLHLA